MALAELCVGDRPAALAVEGLSWGPSPRRTILSDISFTLAPGRMLAVVGPNGAGKSSLLRCLYRYHRPLAGRVRLDGEDIWQLRPRAVARRVATVVQEAAVDFGLTVVEIAGLGRIPHGDSDRHGIDAALEMMGVRDLAARDFASLSGGEKQRVMIARALVQQPDLLILDEPTNHLDIRHQLDMLALLRNLPMTVVVSLHDLAHASAYADSVLVLDKGRQVQWGVPRDVLTAELVRNVFAVEAAIDAHPVTGRPRVSFHLRAV